MEVKNYTGIKAVRKVMPVTDDMIDNAIADYRQEIPVMRPAEKAAEMGDTVLLDFTGYCEGERFAGGAATDYELVLGSHYFIPGFEEQLVGLSAGESRDVNVTFPNEYQKELAGKDAVFKCTVKQVLIVADGDFDDQMAKDMFKVDTVAAAKDLVRKELELQANAQADSDVLEFVLDQICKENPYKADDEMIQFERDEMLDSMIIQMAGTIMKHEEFYKLSGMTKEDFDKVLLPSAERNLNIKEIIKGVAAQENIQANDDDREAQIAASAARFGVTFEQAKNAIPVEELDEPIIMQKTLQFILEHADVTEE